MAAKPSYQGDDERVPTDATRTDEQQDGEVGELQAALERKDEQLQAVIDRYEQVLATRDRLRRQARERDEAFVWTDDEPSTD